MTSGAERVARFVSGFSIEALPREIARWTQGDLPLRAGTRLYITRLPNATFHDTLLAAKRARGFGLRPIPHISARTIRDERELREALAALCSDAGVDEVLVVAGSQTQACGPFESSMQLLETGLFERSGIVRIGLAAHPEGHAAVDDEHLGRVLAQKNAFAASSNLDVYLVTQFFFDAAPVIAWERRVRAQGNRLPVRVGFHGITGAPSLLRHALACGVGASAKLLAQHASLLHLAVPRSPDRLLVELARAAAEDERSLFAGAHFFPLGGFARTAAWANALEDGRFVVEPDDSVRVAAAVPQA